MKVVVVQPGKCTKCRRTVHIKMVKMVNQVLCVSVAQLVKKLPAVQETQVQSLGGEDPLGKEMAAVLPLTWFTGPRVDKAGPGKLEEDSRCCGDCRRVYFLWAAAVSLQGLLRHQTDRGGPWPVGTQAQCCQGQQCSCLQNIRYEAMREGRTA